jgi:O-acetylhomoserine (thiol)-lyase
MTIDAYLDPTQAPVERPSLDAMGATTRELHNSLDDRARAEGTAWLHPTRRTIQRDLLGSPNVIAWQEAKAAFLIAGGGAWSELPHLYARYGTPGGAALIARLRELEGARAVMVTDSGMQALALIADVVIAKGTHGIVMRQIYNKTKTFFEWSAKRAGATLTFVDDGDLDAVRAAVTPQTTWLFAETFTNPLMRAQDVRGLRAALPDTVHLIIDGTIATPWAFREPLLAQGATIVSGSLTKALGGQDAALGGYVATNDDEIGNAVMDLIAMRGGILDDERARFVAEQLAPLEGMSSASTTSANTTSANTTSANTTSANTTSANTTSANTTSANTTSAGPSPGAFDSLASRAHARRCATASRVAAFLARHPRIERVFHPSLPDHPDAAVIAREYVRHGSIVSFRVTGADEKAHRHIADVLVSCGVLRYALSFDGIATKVNHHRTVSEYFTPGDVVARAGIDRLIRLGIGLEDADDLVACLNWTLHHAERVTTADLDAWRAARAVELQLR